MINKKLISDFANIIGNIWIAMSLDSLKDVKDIYGMILNELLQWIKHYYKNRNFNIITHEKSLEIHNLLEEIKWKILPDKNIGDESLLTDNILIRYEVIIKTINDEKKIINIHIRNNMFLYAIIFMVMLWKK